MKILLHKQTETWGSSSAYEASDKEWFYGMWVDLFQKILLILNCPIYMQYGTYAAFCSNYRCEYIYILFIFIYICRLIYLKFWSEVVLA